MSLRQNVTRCCFAKVIKKGKHTLLCYQCGAEVKSFELLTPTQ